jgi:hypothetical protein
VAGRVRGATMSDRVRASENLADRFGLPRMERNQHLVEDAAPKLRVSDHREHLDRSIVNSNLGSS